MEGNKSQTKNKATNKRWRLAESRFFLRFMASQVERGMKTDKFFKEPAFVAAVQVLSVEFKCEYSVANMQNHLRTLKRKWAIIKRVKELSGVGWDDATKKIIMGDEEYKTYIQAHPESEPFINVPIEDYDLLEIVCGNDQATGHFTKQTFEELGQNPNAQAEEQVNLNVNIGLDFVDIDEATPDYTPTSSASQDTSQSESSINRQRTRGKKRSMTVETEVMRNISDNVGKLALAVTNNNQVTLASNLSDECMKMMQYGYTIYDIHRLFNYLNADNIRARGFVGANEMLRRLQAEDYLGPPGSQE